MRSFKKKLLQKKNRTQMKRAQVNDMVGKRYEVNDNGDLNISYKNI